MKDEYGDKCDCWCITTNLRVLVENGWLDDLQYICEPTEYHEKRYTFRLTTSIGVTRELNRHRVNSIAEMSTRYCNYSKDKFGNEVTFCLPSWLSSTEYTEMNSEERIFFRSCEHAEFDYLRLISKGWKPQQAREVLPLCTATEIIHTAYASDWRHFFDLRYFGTTGAPHPNMIELTGLMAKEADKYGIWKELCNQNVEKA
jgi:thymidylate synthase (FAD)